jgi:hypothetical protein
MRVARVDDKDDWIMYFVAVQYAARLLFLLWRLACGFRKRRAKRALSLPILDSPRGLDALSLSLVNAYL